MAPAQRFFASARREASEQGSVQKYVTAAIELCNAAMVEEIEPETA